MNESLTEDNFIFLALKHYDNPSLHSSNEFVNDLKKVKYINKLFVQYETTGQIKERAILNNIIILQNVFGVKFTVKMLLLKTDINYWEYLKAFFIFLNYQPAFVNINNRIVSLDQIEPDVEILEKLKKI